ncbi:hypothetical protein C1752_04560 [Acaryochloris thomasi RCC1774]|uniref:Uncharacterized protein n=1 Tax=Acaryochloris thomasi RCC1774 TaxID=1764569 RepID=A0A2W1JD97_9CYAN|nr:hypothetical protein [Acaryochloris thomasi]PZD71829.1 hypothetical protein C1752_04560 [Acaryochloris thomasi RCC1774]
MQWTSIEDLLADEDIQKHDLTVHFVEPEEKPLAENVEPEASSFEDALDNVDQVNLADLKLLAGMICHRISPLLEIEQERNGFPKSTSLLWQAVNPGLSRQINEDIFAQLTQEMAYQLYRRLEIEQERHGFTQGCLT